MTGYTQGKNGQVSTITHLNDTTVQWQKVAEVDSQNSLGAIAKTSDGIVAVGSHDGRPWVIKFALDGSIQWQKSFELWGYFRGIIPTHKEDGFVIVGTTDISSKLVTLILFEISSSGEVRWQKQYDGLSFPRINSVVQTKDGYLIAGAATFRRYPYTNSSAMLLKIGSDGTMLWQKSYSPWQGGWINTAVVLENWGFIIAGFTGRQNGRGFIAKVNENGQMIWQRAYWLSEGGQIKSVSVDEDRYVAVGHADPPSPASWIFVVDSNGNVLWTKKFVEGSGFMAEWVQVLPTVYTVLAQGYLLSADEKWTNILLNTDRHGKIPGLKSSIALKLSPVTLKTKKLKNSFIDSWPLPETKLDISPLVVTVPFKDKSFNITQFK